MRYLQTICRALLLTVVVLSSSHSIGQTTQPDFSRAVLSDTELEENLKLARKKILQDKPEDALQILDGMSQSEQESSEYHFLRGRALQELRLNVEALASYTIAIYIDKNNVRARINKALVRGALGDVSGALEELSKAYSIEPNNPVIPMNRGITYAGLNQPAKAIEEFNHAIRLDRKYSDAYRNRGITRHYMKDIEGACRDWRQAAFYGDEETREWINHYCRSNQPKPRQKTMIRSNG